MTIRPTTATDIPDLQSVLSQTELFPPEMLPDMFGDREQGGLWLTAVQGTTPVGFCYAQPEQMAEGVWNMLAIAVTPQSQRAALGRTLVAALEAELRGQGVRLLIADTSGTDSFAGTRQFYVQIGYTQEATIRGFWAPGDDKVVFCKELAV